ncbi:hypothetical protein [Actinocatenispora rupis]|uniref:Uncharacterized protein n=1 Tax=Actinocatenispora rupis TaxID=519421 RepID=A0A8J3JHA7_9ACTN|nr:hypothetical protein [Actinocatenispora rupis]GID14913.1 hypothetical protein Aru02nite_58020 [Actinocatenispora rupis]
MTDSSIASWSAEDFKTTAAQLPPDTQPHEVTIAVRTDSDPGVVDLLLQMPGIARAWQDADLERRPLHDLGRLLVAVHHSIRSLRDLENRVIDAVNEQPRFDDADNVLDSMASLLANSQPADLHGLNHKDPASLVWEQPAE